MTQVAVEVQVIDLSEKPVRISDVRAGTIFMAVIPGVSCQALFLATDCRRAVQLGPMTPTGDGCLSVGEEIEGGFTLTHYQPFGRVRFVCEE